jgi:hypothetical protein
MLHLALVVPPLALIALGYWLGEEGAFPLRSAVIAGGLAAFVAALPIARKPWPQKLAVAAGALGLYVLSFQAGSASYRSAFNDCIEKGENVRAALASFAERNKHYPSSLEQLNTPIPCARRVRPTILLYEAVRDGYTLRFQDWLVTFEGTQYSPLAARK